MEFHLVYDGPLHAKFPNVEEQQKIRRAIHPQLAKLWGQLPLSELAAAKGFLDPSPGPGRTSLVAPVGPFQCVSLVSSRIDLVCDLDILFLRPGQPGQLVATGGDIDNRLKTLFDALRQPRDLSELPSEEAPGLDETPFHCLLEDDSLIQGFRVRADRLLTPTSTSHARLVIRVNTRATRVSHNNMALV